jgi:protocatechuate 3,4-dioxygenase beta subunit
MNEINHRRNFLKIAGTAVAALGWARIAEARAEICSVSPAQTRGPFVPDDFPFPVDPQGHPYVQTMDSDADLIQIGGEAPIANGQIVVLRGQIVDENCRAIPNATVYLWQADANGHYNNTLDPNINGEASPISKLDSAFQYRGVVTTDKNGRYQFKTIKPKYYPLDPSEPDFKRTAHLHLAVVAKGYQTLITQSYFEGDDLEDIAEIRRLNKIDIILGVWQNQMPVGKIDPKFLPLVVEYKKLAGQALTGDLRLSLTSI